MTAMKTLITGATGLVGNALALRLARAGHQVRALVRDPARAAPLLPGVELCAGDITEPASLGPAMRDIGRVFHAAGMPEQWQRDERIFDRVNRVGTAHVLDAALAAGVARVVYTSTMDVFAAPSGGTLVESNVDPNPKHTAYERSKQGAEQEVALRRARGLQVVMVNPAAVYGPGPVHVALNSFFIRQLTGKMPVVPPGGVAVVYIDGLVDALLAAGERGIDGERYLVADTYASNLELAREIARVAGAARVPRVAPAWLLRPFAAASAPLARLFGFSPLIAPGQLAFLLWQARVDASKAQRELGFVPTELSAGVAQTIAHLSAEGLVPPRPPAPTDAH